MSEKEKTRIDQKLDQTGERNKSGYIFHKISSGFRSALIGIITLSHLASCINPKSKDLDPANDRRIGELGICHSIGLRISHIVDPSGKSFKFKIFSQEVISTNCDNSHVDFENSVLSGNNVSSNNIRSLPEKTSWFSDFDIKFDPSTVSFKIPF